MAELLFHGACEEVTGSMHMLRVRNKWVALDCGLFQGRRADSEAKNRQWPMNPNEISAVVLSHAHIDHTGRLPLLARDGFDGPIHCTPATRDLSAVMLPDSAHIQQEDAQYVNNRRARKGLDSIEPLYDEDDAIAAVRLMRSVSYDAWFDVAPGLSARFHEAGHMLGSAGVELAIEDNGARRTLYFSGDVGRPRTPILRDPAPFPSASIVICEATYGARVNEPVADAREAFVKIVKATIDRGGKVIIPAFSVGRTQTIMYYLHEAISANLLPHLPVFVDSPLALNATEVFRTHPECFDQETRKLQQHAGDPFGLSCCTYIREVEESKRLHQFKGPCVIISASGMCEAGRIRHHIKNNVQDARNTLLFVGYQAVNTLGRRLVDGVKAITLFHEEYAVRCQVLQIHGFSGHADQTDLLRSLIPLRGTAERIFLVHAEPEQSTALTAKLNEAGVHHAALARRGERCEI
ncbi:MAG: MBL fold metallo-hydrolase [Phycisphaerales bacterium]|nr:MBL fold metallo-hydrolase [Phycisphaerales bacterium]